MCSAITDIQWARPCWDFDVVVDDEASVEDEDGGGRGGVEEVALFEVEVAEAAAAEAGLQTAAAAWRAAFYRGRETEKGEKIKEQRNKRESTTRVYTWKRRSGTHSGREREGEDRFFTFSIFASGARLTKTAHRAIIKSKACCCTLCAIWRERRERGERERQPP